jgi:broad specificity phosphatase PhoE
MSNLYLIRHGQASFGLRDYDQLSELGVIQSELLGRWLASSGAKAGRLICGRMKRHRQTAEACARSWGQTAEIAECAAFDEFNHREILKLAHPEFAEPGRLESVVSGSGQGRRALQVAVEGSIARWMSGQHDADYSESWNAFRSRCVQGLRDVAAADDVWIFTSGGPIAAIAQGILGISDDKMTDLVWSILNSSVSHFALSGGQCRLVKFNSAPHLAAANLQSYF